ncbi:hypothetical protein CRD60_01615 [Bifidobacterium aemilianum]|uniref:Uncharacterized protein n=1 Tax=Bifidobacterium aemilianum TaxID=2493120 RepID=A0A366KBS7_9BIFI|nr:hypothetical protein [Bifidobacterium aemilianum]RBP98573.1 hypothetical protein CRD60_01615 [Bifidobacterium aemilianum]
MADDHKPQEPDDAGQEHFSDEDLEAALSQFEEELAASSAQSSQEDESPQAPESSAAAGQQGAAASADAGQDNPGALADQTEADLAALGLAESSFDDELQGLIGNKAKVAALVTRLASGRLLAAFCQLSDIAAVCVGSDQGAVAFLHNLDGDSPEAAAKDLTTVVSGMAAVLTVNRADKLDSTLYLHGEPGQTFAPPVLFSFTPPFLEDLMLGIGAVDDLKQEGYTLIDTASMDRDQAMQVIAEHTRYGRGGPSIQ